MPDKPLTMAAALSIGWSCSQLYNQTDSPYGGVDSAGLERRGKPYRKPADEVEEKAAH